jgi:Rad3-related DNA helicase
MFTVKPIFVGSMMSNLLTTYNLFMSGTITESYAYDILELSPDETEIIQLESVFPPENKPIFFIGKQALNYNTLKDPETIDTLKTQIKKIVNFHDGQKGLILVPSFYLGNQLSYGIKYTRVFEHKSGTNISELIEDFKKYKGSAVFVSPSIFEGLSFDGDDCRFQVLVKAPYDSLGDKRIKHIADNYPKIYQEMALLKIIQGAGRGVRSPDDFAASYCLDSSIQRLFNSKSNIWKSHFKVMSK